MKYVFALAMFATGLVVWSPSALACECENRPGRDESYRIADYVFYATATKTDDGFALKVIENFKGTRAKRVLNVTESGDCAFRFADGKNYMVFATKGEGKALVVDRCAATAQLDHPPLDVSIWNLADEISRVTKTKVADRHASARDVVTERAVKKIKAAANSCDPEVWKAKESMKARIEVRFDIEPGGAYAHEVLKYDSPVATSSEVTKCLTEKLAKDEFKAFPGGRVSVVAYWMIDRLDASFGHDRSSATVVEYKSDKHLLE